MLISDDPNYTLTLKGINNYFLFNQVVLLLRSRDTIVSDLLADCMSGRTIGPKSQEILKRDINKLLDNVFGVEFI